METQNLNKTKDSNQKVNVPKKKSWNPPFLVKDWYENIQDAEKAFCEDFEPDFKWWMLKILGEETPPDYDQILEAIRSSPTLGEQFKREEELLDEECEKKTVSLDTVHHTDFSTPPIEVDMKGEAIERVRLPSRPLLKKPNLNELFQEQNLKIFDDDLLVIPPTQPPTPPADILEDRRSVFQKMLSMTKNEVAANWRKPIQKTSISEMTLEEQSEFESAQIAKEFCKWLESIGMENLRIDENTLKELFDINLNIPATLSFCVEIKELPSVPKSISQIYQVKHKAEREITRQLLKWDAGYERGETRSIAFGKCLPVPLKHKPWKKDIKNLWFWPKHVNKNLKSGRALWENLLGSEVLDYYCIWLIENPQQKVPEFLNRIGYIDKVRAKYEQNKEKYDLIKKNKHGDDEFWLFSKKQYDQNEEKYIDNISAYQEIQLIIKEKVQKNYCEDCEDDLKLFATKKEMLLEEQRKEQILNESETVIDMKIKDEECEGA